MSFIRRLIGGVDRDLDLDLKADELVLPEAATQDVREEEARKPVSPLAAALESADHRREMVLRRIEVLNVEIASRIKERDEWVLVSQGLASSIGVMREGLKAAEAPRAERVETPQRTVYEFGGDGVDLDPLGQ